MDETQVAPLLAHIAHSIMAPAMKKRLFRPPYFQFPSYLLVYQEAFEIGVVLGYAYKERIVILAKLLCAPGKELGFVELVQELGDKRLASHANPKTFIDLGMAAEDKRIRGKWRESGVTEYRSPLLENLSKCPQTLHGTILALHFIPVSASAVDFRA